MRQSALAPGPEPNPPTAGEPPVFLAEFASDGALLSIHQQSYIHFQSGRRPLYLAGEGAYSIWSGYIVATAAESTRERAIAAAVQMVLNPPADVLADAGLK